MKKDFDMMVVMGRGWVTIMEPRVYVINTWDIVVRLFDVIVVVNFLLNLEILIHTLLLPPPSLVSFTIFQQFCGIPQDLSLRYQSYQFIRSLIYPFQWLKSQQISCMLPIESTTMNNFVCSAILPVPLGSLPQFYGVPHIVIVKVSFFFIQTFNYFFLICGYLFTCILINWLQYYLFVSNCLPFHQTICLATSTTYFLRYFLFDKLT